MLSFIAVRRALQFIRAAVGSYDPTYLPRSVRRLNPPIGQCFLAVKGWFGHGRFGFQREPWDFVQVWCDGKLAGSVMQGIGRASRLVTSLDVGPHTITLVGFGIENDTSAVLHEDRIWCGHREVHYIAFVPPRPNPFARTPSVRARWFSSSWGPGEHGVRAGDS